MLRFPSRVALACLLTSLAVLSGTAAAGPTTKVAPISLNDLHDPNAVVPIHAATLRPEGDLESHPRHRPVHFDVVHYDLNIAVDPIAGSIAGAVRVDLTSTIAGLDTIALDAVDMQILKVLDAQDRELTFTYDGEIVTAQLLAPLALGETASVTVEYRALLSQSLMTTGPDATDPGRMPAAYTYTQPEGSAEWYPCLDRPSDKATLTSAITVPASFNALSNGDLLGAVNNGTTTTYSYRMEQPIATYLVSLAIGQYDVLSIGDFLGKPLTIWAPPHIRAATIRETARTGRMMEVFSDFTGTVFPFNSYAQSVAQAYRSSMEHQSATTMGGWRITGDSSGEGVVAHELAHQWFGDWVTCRSWSELWLNEGYATYLPYVFFAAEGETTRALGQLDSWRRNYFAESKTHARALSSADPDISNIFDAHSYEKGGLVIHLMRNIARAANPAASPEPFTVALRDYLRVRGGGNVTSVDLQGALERTTGASWQLFFDQWVRAAGHPILSITPSWSQGVLSLRVEQTQYTRATDPWGTFTFPLTFEVVKADGQVERRTFEVYDDVQTFSWALAEAPRGLVADPEWLVPAEITLIQAAADWQAVLELGDTETARLTALRAIQSLNGGQVSADVAALVRADSSVYLRTEALALFSADAANREFILDIYRDLSQLRTLDIATHGALARTEDWLVRTLGRTPGRDEESRWRTRYLGSGIVAQRSSLLSMLDFASHERAQEFARERLSESNWVTQDRTALIDLLTLRPTAVSEPFIDEAVKNASTVYMGQVLRNLTAANYDRPEIVDALLQGAANNGKIGVRAAMIGLLAKQVSSRDRICPELAPLKQAGVGTLQAALLESVRLAAGRAEQVLGCAL